MNEVITLERGRDYKEAGEPKRARKAIKGGARRKHSTNPAGRVDIALERVGELLIRNVGERLGVDLWEGGLRDITRAAIRESGVPRKPLTPVALARMVGILPERRRHARA